MCYRPTSLALAASAGLAALVGSYAVLGRAHDWNWLLSVSLLFCAPKEVSVCRKIAGTWKQELIDSLLAAKTTNRMHLPCSMPHQNLHCKICLARLPEDEEPVVELEIQPWHLRALLHVLILLGAA